MMWSHLDIYGWIDVHNVFLPLLILSIMSRSAKEWSSPQNALAYLNVADNLPHKSEGDTVLDKSLA